MTKLLEVLKSQNFIASIIGMVLLALKANGIYEEDITQDVLLEKGKELYEVAYVFIILPAIKLIRNFAAKEWTWDFLKSSNFWAFVTTALTLFLGVFLNEGLAATLVGLLINFVNVTRHASLPVKHSQEPVLQKVKVNCEEIKKS